MRKITVTFTFDTDATDEQIYDMVSAARVQIEEPADAATGDDMDATVSNVAEVIGLPFD